MGEHECEPSCSCGDQYAAAPAAGADPAADGAKIRDEVTREIAGWMAAPHEPEQWQIDNADDLATNLLTGPLAALVAERDQAQAKVRAVEALRRQWKDDGEDPHLWIALRRALDDEAAGR